MAKHIGIDKILIPNATNRKAVLLIAAAPADICLIVVQKPAPRKVTTELAKRRKVAVVPHTAVITISGATETRRKSGKT